MEETTDYEVEITTSGKLFYLELLDYFYTYSSRESASRKADELYEKALSLSYLADRGQVEEMLASLAEEYKYILYYPPSGSTIKIIYYLDKASRRVYVTDFFPTRMDSKKLTERNKPSV